IERAASPDFERRLLSAINNGWRGVNLSLPLNWNNGSRSIQFRFHAWEPLGILLAGYSETGNSKALAISVDLAKDWNAKFQEQYFTLPLKTGLTSALAVDDSMAWYDMSVGQRAPRLAYLVDVVARQKGNEALAICLFRSLIFQME